MKNLENYGVQELDAREVKQVEGGGFWGELGFVLGYIAGKTFDEASGVVFAIDDFFDEL